MVVAAGEPIPMESFQRSPKATPSTSGPDRPSLHCCERISPVKNRTPHLFASAFFVHLLGFSRGSFDCKNGRDESLVDVGSRSVGQAGRGPVKAGDRPRLRRLSA